MTFQGAVATMVLADRACMGEFAVLGVEATALSVGPAATTGPTGTWYSAVYHV